MHAIKKATWLFLIFLCTTLTNAFAATQTNSPTTCTNVTGVGTKAWTNPGSALALDNAFATASLANTVNNTTSNYLQCTGFGFTIPAGSTITGISVSVARKSSSTGTQDSVMRLVKGGTIGTVDRSTTTAYTTTTVTEAHGGTSDLWGSYWLFSDINATNFGAAFAAIQTSADTATRTVSVDQIQITVTYTPFQCNPPSNAPSGVTLTCVCDNFDRTTLNPSTIYNSNWVVSTSDTTGLTPNIQNKGFLRLTSNTGNNAKAATVPGFFPAAGNYISVEFQHFAYNGSGADGIAVILSDYTVPAVPGAYGGSLGYAQKTGINGFAGGWLGVGLDEFGNYQNPSEGRIGGTGFIAESIGIRGSGSGTNGYQWIAGTAALSAPQIDIPSSTTPGLGYYYQVVVDARNDPTSTTIAVNRDSGAGYASIINIPNVYSAATSQGFTQATVPANWQISFTGSTGGSTNIHELSGVRICAQSIAPPSGGTASGFNAIDEAYGTPPSVAIQNYLTGHIYMKLEGVPFKLNIPVINNNQIQTAYVGSGTKNVTVKLVDNSDGACVLDSAQANYCSATCKAKTAVATQTLAFNTTDKGQKQSAAFTINSAYQNLAAIISDSSASACSTDSFSVRPLAISAVTTSSTYTSASSTPILKAGSDSFTLTATTTGIAANASNYTGILKLNNAALTLAGTGTTAGSFTPSAFAAATSATAQSTSTGNFTYTEVGGFQFNGYNPATDTTSLRGIYDDTWTAIDSPLSKGDCLIGNYANTKDANGKYGCNFGLSQTLASSPVVGRFIPDHFSISLGSITNRSDIAACNAVPASNLFTYFGEQMTANFTLTAQASNNATTQNYSGSTAAKFDPSVFANLNLGASDRVTYAGTPGFWTATQGASAVTCTTSPCFTAGSATISAPIVLPRAASPSLGSSGPFTNVSVGTKVTDSDGVTIAPLSLDTSTVAGTTIDHGLIATVPNLRYGRLLIDNVYGSELLKLPINVRAQYWNNGTWVTNIADNCTVLNSTNIVQSQGSGATITSTLTGTTLSLGIGKITLGKPTPTITSKGSVILSTPASYYLPGKATETFGLYKNGPVIYVREVH